MFAQMNRTSSVEERNAELGGQRGLYTSGITAEVQEENSVCHKTSPCSSSARGGGSQGQQEHSETHTGVPGAQ